MLPRLFWMLALIAAPLVAATTSPQSLAWPTVERDTKPWTRWWWLGNIADEQSITTEMEKYAAVGLGGIEITPIYGVRGYEDRFVPFLSPRWTQLFEHILAEGRRLNLGIDLATGTGWPFGGPWLSETDTAHYLAHQKYSLPPGGRLATPITFIQRGLIRYAGPRRPPLAEIKQPITANPNLQDLALDQVRFEQPLPVVSVMAFPSRGQPVDVTRLVTPDGQLDWTAPADGGDWTVYALFQGQHGKMVERAGPGGEGFALDHLSSTALKNYLAAFDRAFAGHATGGVRAYFNDSYEVDDSQGEADFSPRFFDEFSRRRGYDLRTRLPDLFATVPGEMNSRVLSDYRETVSDLLVDEFTTPWRQWAHARGSLIRNQSHGSPANILDLYAASDIPEQEGNGLLAMKLASSAAHLTGKPLTSAETATWLNEHFLSTLSELKSTVDTFLLGGINHNCYHGTAFSPPNEPWPGFQFYASVELSPANPLWHDFAIVNAYVTRAQSFLQTSQPDEDVLLYYNIHDRWAERGDGTLPHFGHGRDPIGTTAGVVAENLRAGGFGFDFVSDRLLTGVSFHEDALRSASARYAAIVVPETNYMPLATLERLVGLAEQGATVVMLQRLPVDAPGLHQVKQPFQALLEKIRAAASVDQGITTAPLGRGRFLIGPDLNALLSRHGNVRAETLGSFGLEYLRRQTDTGPLYFLVNRGTQTIDGWVPFRSAAVSAALYQPMTGQSGLAASRPSASGGAEIYLQLAPGETCFVQFQKTALLADARWSYWKSSGPSLPLKGEWSVSFVAGGPELPASAKTTTLQSWTQFGGEAVKAFSGTATYTLTVQRPAGEAAAYTLDLGEVASSARVKLNGREIAGLVQAPWRVVIPASELLPTNSVQIDVTNLAANRIADMDRRGVPWKKFYNVNMPARLRENAGPDGLFTAAHWAPRASGLLGPVSLTPLATLVPSSAP